MELLLILLPLGLLAAFGLGGGGSEEDAASGGEPPPPENEIIAGDDDPDTIDGEGGDDLIFGAGGRDQIEGGEEADNASGNDILVGEGGGDRLIGGNQNDILLGGGGDDVLSGGNDNDGLVGGAGDDSADGGAGNDLMIDTSGADLLDGGAGNDLLFGIDLNANLSAADAVAPLTEVMGDVLTDRYGAGVAQDALPRVVRGLESADDDTSGDQLLGGEGNDTLIGDGRDVMTGGAGDDSFAVYNPSGTDIATIMDFDPAAEDLVVILPPGATGGPITFAPTGPGSPLAGTHVLVDGRIVALLQGVAPASINPASVTLEELDL